MTNHGLQSTLDGPENVVPFFRSDIGLLGDPSFPGFRGRGEEFGV